MQNLVDRVKELNCRSDYNCLDRVHFHTKYKYKRHEDKAVEGWDLERKIAADNKIEPQLLQGLVCKKTHLVFKTEE